MAKLFTLTSASQRDVAGYAIGGGVMSAVTAAATSSTETKDLKYIGKKALKRGLQGAVATGVAVSVVNTLNDPIKHNWNAVGALALGFTAIYALEKGIKEDEQKHEE